MVMKRRHICNMYPLPCYATALTHSSTVGLTEEVPQTIHVTLSLNSFYLVNIIFLQQRNGKDIITEKLNVTSLCEADSKAPITLS